MNLYHYYDKTKGPFKNLSDCSVDEANKILGKYVRSRHALLKALTRPFLGFVLNPKSKMSLLTLFVQNEILII